jgi:hypothetical protein
MGGSERFDHVSRVVPAAIIYHQYFIGGLSHVQERHGPFEKGRESLGFIVGRNDNGKSGTIVERPFHRIETPFRPVGDSIAPLARTVAES